MNWPEIPQGISTRLMAAGTRTLQQYRPSRKHVKADAVAGAVGAVGSVSDGMAASVLAKVNPIYGLYASMVGRFVGGFFVSTQRLIVTTTSAAAIATVGVLNGLDGEARNQALFLLALLIILGQIGTFVGYDPPGSNTVAQAIHVVLHPAGSICAPSSWAASRCF
jgi:MFS superfamily sulfate permease-like transporter